MASRLVSVTCAETREASCALPEGLPVPAPTAGRDVLETDIDPLRLHIGRQSNAFAELGSEPLGRVLGQANGGQVDEDRRCFRSGHRHFGAGPAGHHVVFRFTK